MAVSHHHGAPFVSLFLEVRLYLCMCACCDLVLWCGLHHVVPLSEREMRDIGRVIDQQLQGVSCIGCSTCCRHHVVCLLLRSKYAQCTPQLPCHSRRQGGRRALWGWRALCDANGVLCVCARLVITQCSQTSVSQLSAAAAAVVHGTLCCRECAPAAPFVRCGCIVWAPTSAK